MAMPKSDIQDKIAEQTHVYRMFGVMCNTWFNLVSNYGYFQPIKPPLQPWDLSMAQASMHHIDKSMGKPFGDLIWYTNTHALLR